MKNLVADLLIKLSRIEVDAKDLTAQVEAQALVIAGIILVLDKELADNVSSTINNAIVSAVDESSEEILTSDVELLHEHIDRLFSLPRIVEKNT
jgi:hypothetical protein